MKRLGLYDTLETERCILRIAKESEAEYMWNMITESTTRYMIWEKGDTYEGTMKSILKSRLQSFEEKTWEASIYDRETWVLLGRCWINQIVDDIPSFQIGYWIAEKHYGKGYVPECVQKIVKFCFEESNFEKGIIKCDSENQNSQKVAIKCGFEYEWEWKSEWRIRWKLRNTKFFGITKEQYLKQK